MKHTTEILREILYPAEDFSPVPFWFFNDEPDEERIKSQLEDYVEKGVHALVLHPRIGVPESCQYLSEEYFNAVRFIVKTAAELNMKIVLYDEGMYPSGSAHGAVVEANPEFASKGIHLTKEPQDETIITRYEDDTYLVYGFTGGTIRGIHFGEDDGEAGAPKSADILNPEAVDTFIKLTHDRYYEELKEYFGNTVIAFFTDEPCALGRNAESYREWVEGMETELMEAGGSLAELREIFTDRACRNHTAVLYHKLIKKHLRENFYAKLSDWCVEHGIALMGHPEVSDDVEEELYFQIPGQDLILRRVAPETGGITEFDSVQAKLPADIARHLGRRRNANECFGVCNRNGIPWYFTGKDMKWYLNWLGLRGVNLFVPHAFYYSVIDRRKDERPPDVGPNNIWWKHYRLFSDYMKRLSYLMTDSVNGARVAVLCDNNQVPYEELAILFEQQIEFNYLPVALLDSCKVENGKLCIGDYCYEVIVNAGGQFEIAAKAKELQAMTVVEDTKVFATEKYAALKSVKLEQEAAKLRAVQLKKNGIKMLLISNEGEEIIRNGLWVSDTENIVLVDLWKGSYKKVRMSGQNTYVPFTLRPCEMLLLMEGEVLEEPEGCVEELESEKSFVDLTESFTCQWKKENTAGYRMNYEVKDTESRLDFLVRGEEMAECYCNGQLVGVSFYEPHYFTVSGLAEGENEISIVMTGNAANLYEQAGIPFGIK